MPYTAKQKRLFGADLARQREGKSTRTGMTATQLKEGVKAPTKPPRKKRKS